MSRTEATAGALVDEIARGVMRVAYTRLTPEPVYGGAPRAFIRGEVPAKRCSIGCR